MHNIHDIRFDSAFGNGEVSFTFASEDSRTEFEKLVREHHPPLFRPGGAADQMPTSATIVYDSAHEAFHIYRALGKEQALRQLSDQQRIILGIPPGDGIPF